MSIKLQTFSGVDQTHNCLEEEQNRFLCALEHTND